MRRMLALLFVVAFTGAAWAQEEAEEPRREPVRRLKVLHNPYDIVLFYRSSQEPNYFGFQPPPALDRRYPIASFYRSRQSQPFGYSAAPAPYGPRAYGRGSWAGDNLFLFAPTFLAPVGPLSGAFFER